MTDVAVNLATARATVDHEPELGRRRGAPAGRSPIRGTTFWGFPTTPGRIRSTAAREREIQDLKTRFAVGIVLSVHHLHGLDAALVPLPRWGSPGSRC